MPSTDPGSAPGLAGALRRFRLIAQQAWLGPGGPDRRRQSWIAALLLGFVVFAAGALVQRMAGGGGHHFLAYLGTTLFGALVGATELVARYRDKPVAPLGTTPGLIYVAVNAAVALIVFWFLRTGAIAVNVVAGLSATLNQVLLAGFGSMALLRTSLFTLRVKETDIFIGPAAVLQVILAAADRECDRLRAGPRAKEVKEIMRGVSFARAKLALTMHCLALMQNVSAAEDSQLRQAISSLETATMSDEVKAYNLGLLLMNFVGEDVLREAVDALGSVILGPSPDDPPIFAQAGSLAFADMPTLISLCAALDPMGRDDLVAAQREAWVTLRPDLPREQDRNVVVLAQLRRFFGADTLSRAIALMVSGKGNAQPFTAALPLSAMSAPAGGGQAAARPAN